MKLHSGEIGHKRIEVTSGHRIAHRDIDVHNLRRYGVQKRHKQGLVGKHHSAVNPVTSQSTDFRHIASGKLIGKPCEYLGHHLDLADRRRDAHNTYLRHLHPLTVELHTLRKLLHILRHEEG